MLSPNSHSESIRERMVAIDAAGLNGDPARQDMFREEFISHLDALEGVGNLLYEQHSRSLTQMDISRYKSNVEKIELCPDAPTDVSDDAMEDVHRITNLAYDTFVGQLGKDKSSKELRQFALFTAERVSNFVWFHHVYPKIVNPYTELVSAALENRIVLYANDYEEVKDFKLGVRTNDKNPNNLALVATSKSKLASGGRNRFSGYVVDDRYKLQNRLMDELRRLANGKGNARRISDLKKDSALGAVLAEMDKSNVPFKNVLFSLKRQGLLGSSTAGFFVIQGMDDILETLKHHHTNKRGIEKTMKVLVSEAELRFKQSVRLNLETEKLELTNVDGRMLFQEDFKRANELERGDELAFLRKKVQSLEHQLQALRKG